MSEKTCTKCGKIQPLSEFNSDKKGLNGRSSQCRGCNGAACRERYQKNKVKYNEQSEAWVKEHAEDRKEYMAAYYEANKEKLREQKRAYYLANKVRLNAASAEYVQQNSEQRAAYQSQYYEKNGETIRARARERSREMDGYVRGIYSRKRRMFYRDLRVEVLTRLGGKCYCCGLDDYRFLTIDHVQNDGKHDRKPNGKGRSSYMVLRVVLDSGCSPDRYRAACYNCNCARQLAKDKICPHQQG